jgi:hypothetical protein
LAAASAGCDGTRGVTSDRTTYLSLPTGRNMTDKGLIKAYTVDASGELVPLATDSVVLEFPSGKCLEIEWVTFAGEPGPLSARVWGGRRAPMINSEAELEEAELEEFKQAEIEEFKRRISSIGIVPLSGNEIRIFPFSSLESN